MTTKNAQNDSGKHIALCVSVEHHRSRFPLQEIPLSAEIRLPPEQLSPEHPSYLEQWNSVGGALFCRAVSRSQISLKWRSRGELLRSILPPRWSKLLCGKSSS
jgi:hypothetical protein